MFAYLHYNGREPEWARDLMESGLLAFSPARTMASQIPGWSHLEDVAPCTHACDGIAYNFGSHVGGTLSENLEHLLAADGLASTDILVWRDRWLLSRSDVVIVENGASLEIPMMAKMWRIPVIAVSWSPAGMNPWLAVSAGITLNSPQSAAEIRSYIPVSENDEPIPEKPEPLQNQNQRSGKQSPPAPVGACGCGTYEACAICT